MTANLLFLLSCYLLPLPVIFTLYCYQGGTGQIMSALKAGEIDLSIALTEALIAGIVKKTADYKIVGTYVTSYVTSCSTLRLLSAWKLI